MDLGRSVVEPLRRRPAVADALLGVVAGVVFLVGPVVARDGLRERAHVDLTLTAPGIALTVLAAMALTQRRRHPALTLTVLATVAALSIVGGWQVLLATPALILAVYGYSVRAPRAPALVAAGATSITVVLAGLVAGLWRGRWGQPDDVVLWLWTATAVAVAVQGRRATIAALEDRARRAEESREETARRRVAEDRVRIARELHDVIAHHVAVISVQSGVAEHLVERDPAAAREALHHVRTSAKSVLTELQSVLGVLRQDESALPTAPAPGLSGLDSLVRSARSMGTAVEVRSPASMPSLSLAADSAGFRLVQEALTNVQKHAAGAPTTVQVETTGTTVVLSVTNAPPPHTPAAHGPHDAPTGSGLGLVGMRERVLAAGGSLETGPTADGGFRVTARLPLAQEDR
ncbi:sensor histidine kinase [Cellulomonas sp. KRMCY2]|uniref:sensor histidine kinase n=1 Tax=Cellulomonas sp. KRMCY2 TaxID=1304865 RepID=UPI00045EBE8F|nr:histidine kinase [Cellulomonas sp. KRMCY2]